MELRQIEFFLQLYKDRNITVASQNLYISQQGMSKSIANLEKEVGFPLFKRSVSGVKPTAEAPAMSPIKPEIVPKIPPTRRTSGSFNPAQIRYQHHFQKHLFSLHMRQQPLHRQMQCVVQRKDRMQNS